MTLIIETWTFLTFAVLVVTASALPICGAIALGAAIADGASAFRTRSR